MQFGKYHEILVNIMKLEYIIKLENNMNLENIMKFGKYPKLEKQISSILKNIMKLENNTEIWKISLKFGKYH